MFRLRDILFNMCSTRSKKLIIGEQGRCFPPYPKKKSRLMEVDSLSFPTAVKCHLGPSNLIFRSQQTTPVDFAGPKMPASWAPKVGPWPEHGMVARGIEPWFSPYFVKRKFFYLASVFPDSQKMFRKLILFDFWAVFVQARPRDFFVLM